MPQYGITPMEVAPICLNNMIIPSDLENIDSPIIELPVDTLQQNHPIVVTEDQDPSKVPQYQLINQNQ